MARRESTNPALTRLPAMQDGYAGFRDRPDSGRPAPAGQPGSQGGIDYTRPGPQPYGPPVGGDTRDSTHRPVPGPVDTGRMTFEDVIVKTAVLLGIVAVVGALSWAADLRALFLPAVIGGFVLGLVISLKQITNPVPIVAYAAVQGFVLGLFSKFMVGFAGGDEAIVVQAVVGTIAVAAVMLGLYRSGRIRVTPRFQKVVLAALLGFVVLIMANLVFSLFTGGAGLRGGTTGIVVGLAAIVLASLVLVLDFDYVAKAVANGTPERFAWYAAFGLVVTLVWLYTEILRVLALFNSD